MTLIILFLLVSLILSLPVFFVVKFSEETALFRDYATEMWHSTGPLTNHHLPASSRLILTTHARVCGVCGVCVCGVWL
jgi:hypothetical protein